MKASQLVKSKKQVRVPVEVTAFFVLAISLNGMASTGPSWNSEPAWANPDSTNSPTYPVKKSQARKKDISDSNNLVPYAPGTNNVALDIGQEFLMGDLSHYSDSIGGQVHYDYGVSDLFAFDASAGYSSHSSGLFSMSSVLAGLRTNLAWYDRVVPYFVFGLGFYRPSFTQDATAAQAAANQTGDSVSPLLFGIHVGPGVDLALSRQVFFGAALTLHDIFGSNQQVMINRQLTGVGGTYASFLLHAGVTF